MRSLEGKIWELRATGQMQHRILYFAVAGQRPVLLHAFTKNTQKKPQAEIETVRKRMVEYLDLDRMHT
ncbi:MAG: hypothetical protein EPO21_08590 [Chloroflexota bacterium]|nr:MAG: hypothetical protein EPO21_08590 [Chloroflexota bacterium]